METGLAPFDLPPSCPFKPPTKKKKNLTHPGQSRGRGGYKKSLPERADSGARVMMIQSQTSWLISANICKCPSQLPSRSLFASGGDGLECDLTPQGLLLMCVCVCVCVCVGACAHSWGAAAGRFNCVFSHTGVCWPQLLIFTSGNIRKRGNGRKKKPARRETCVSRGGKT